jgi:hypothetical protein
VPETQSREQRVDRWIDRLEIREALAEYFRALNRRDADRAKRIFHADAHEQHGPVAGKAHLLIDEFVDFGADAHEVAIRHVLDVWIEFSGDEALSEAGWINVLRDTADDMFYAGRYLDRWQRRDGEWKIAARVAVVDWWRYEARNDRLFFAGAEDFLKFSGRGFEDAEIRSAIGLGQAEASR